MTWSILDHSQVLLKDKQICATPSRIMSVLIDHETWFDGVEVASPEKPDGGKQNTAEFPDWQKNYVAQSIARLESQNNQQVLITVPIRLDLRVGSTVEIRIPNQSPTQDRQPDYMIQSTVVFTWLLNLITHVKQKQEEQTHT